MYQRCARVFYSYLQKNNFNILHVGCATRHGRGKNENLFDKKYFSTFGKSVVINPGQSIGC